MTEEVAAKMVREQIVNAVARTLAACGIERAEYRAALVATQMAGIAIGRYVVGFAPLIEADRAALVAAFGPSIQRYLTGTLKEEARA